MKNWWIILAGLIICPGFAKSQITTPVIKARFGVDADLRANFFNGLVQAGNDDWFNLVAADTSGKAVIDTTGAAAMIAGYLGDASPWPRRMASHYRTMSRPTFSIVNNRLWLDALWVRDYHGTDTTVFTASSDKNGMSPVNWTGGIQGIPDKNDILDVFVHIRRAGPNTTDSLWMFGGISMDNTTGNRYFDFEMYQTDIYYDRASGDWFGYGPDAGHTSWQFDAAGNVTRSGDIIFSGEFQSSTLTNIEARIWVSRSTWTTVVPSGFNWSGQFDGAYSGSPFGYASIVPKTSGAFYTGLGSSVNTWAGQFRLVLQDNSLVTNYVRDQFIELSVNLSKLGLDPVGLSGGDICGTPFNRIVIKTRASASFTAELKDFVAPTDLFLAPRVQAVAEIPIFCDSTAISDIYVINPSASSIYEWSTPNGHILGSNIGPVIRVDEPGTYIVVQRLSVGCNPYASDTVTIIVDSLTCSVLNSHLLSYTGKWLGTKTKILWTVSQNELADHFEIEKSIDGHVFNRAGTVMSNKQAGQFSYIYYDQPVELFSSGIYYRIKAVGLNGSMAYSQTISIRPGLELSVRVAPNPVKNSLSVSVSGNKGEACSIYIYDAGGKFVYRHRERLTNKTSIFGIKDISHWNSGLYMVAVYLAERVVYEKILVIK